MDASRWRLGPTLDAFAKKLPQAVMVLRRIGIITIRQIMPTIDDIFYKHDHLLSFLSFALIHLTVLSVGVAP